MAVPVLADEPVSSEKPLIICLDPGHGARDSGACATYDGVEYQEADLVLQIGLYLREELETYKNVEVLMTRTDRQGELPTINPSEIKPRTDYAREHDADLLVSLHLNASEDTSIRGVMVLTSNGYYNKDIAEIGNGVGTNIVNALAQLGLQNRGHLKKNSADNRYPNGTVADYYAIVRNGILQKIPSLIVEHCFLTNADDFKEHLSSNEKLRELALADADGIAAYYGLEKKGGADDTPISLTDYAGHWAQQYIDDAIDHGWVNGYPDNTFRPDNTLTRADFVTLLSRLSGEELPTVQKSPFPDFRADAYYAESVAWAVNAGVINGYEDGTFRPKLPITREQMAHIMALYLKHKGLDAAFDGDADALDIPDLEKVAAWAKDDVLFCYHSGLLNGRSKGFEPKGNATRAEACTILIRLWNYEEAQSQLPTDPDATPEPTQPTDPESTPAPTVPAPETPPPEATDPNTQKPEFEDDAAPESIADSAAQGIAFEPDEAAE